MKTINVGKDFYPRLANRDPSQGDGKHHAIEFRNKFLKELDSEEAWKSEESFIELDFSEVDKIGPSFANEAFAFFTQYASPEKILNKILFKRITTVKRAIIERELQTGYNSLK